MRYKVKSSEVAHLWAHQTQDHAEAPSAMSFRGPDFYSYNTVIGSIVKDASGDHVYLISEGHYSVTTSAHMGDMRRAIPNSAKQFHVPGVRTGCSDLSDSERIVEAWKREIEQTLETAGTSRQPKKNRLLAEAAGTLDTMRDYVTAFAVKHVEFPVIVSNSEELAKWVAEKNARAEVAKRKAEAKQKRAHARLRREYTADREAWINGEPPRHYSWYQYFPVELRIVAGEVETSMGAIFPLDHARKGLLLVESVIHAGREWKTNGHACHLGNYQIDRIAPDGTVYAGCHEVHYPAIARIREQLLAA
jgi:hypothetical protein